MIAPSLDWLVSRPIAHRGLHDRAAGIIENSLGAADAAIARGYAIECDVQLSRDGEAMVFHDHALERLTGRAGLVGDLSAAELGRLTLTGGQGRIPTLTAFLDRIAGRVPVVVEIKSRYTGDLRLTRRTIEICRGRAALVVESFDPKVVAALRELAPDLPRGIVAQDRYDDAALSEAEARAMAGLLHYDETQPHFLSWRVGDLPSSAPFLCRRLAGIPVTAWTVRAPEDVARATAHADQIVFEGFLA